MHPNIWQPFTVLKGAPEPIKVREGEGIWLTLEDDRRIIDCISSWWVNLHGHCHPRIVKAIHEQSKVLEHVIFANYSHEPAEQLAERLTEKLPGDLNRLFFSDNGSTAVEVALKMAWQFWKNRNAGRSRFLAFEGSYHGDTMGAMSAGSRSIFSRVYSDLMFDVDYLPYPETWIGDTAVSGREDQALALMEKKLSKSPDRYAGIIIEPLIQGAGGMRMCREEFLQKLQKVARRFDTLLIFDEVMTGFGRTGDWFAGTRSQVEPDIICLSKGITGGFLPLAVTACNDRIYQAFNSSDPVNTFWHGHSYTANPLGCAAAIASLELMEENENSFMGMEKVHQDEMSRLAQNECVEKTRIMGTVAAFTIRSDSESGYLNEIGGTIRKRCVDYGLLLRPLGDTVYLMPPYCITESELRGVYRKLGALLEDLKIDMD